MSQKILRAKITADARQFKSELKSVRKTISKTAKYISTAMAVGVGAGLAKATKDAMDFGLQMRNVNTIAGWSEKQFKSMSNQVLDLSQDLGVDLIDATKGLYQALSLGIPKENALDFMRIASKTAIAGLSDTESSVNVLASVMNSFGMHTMKDTQKISDLMFQTVKFGATKFNELAGSLGLVAPIASAAGVKFNELMAAIASTTKQGLTTEQTMTALKGAINGLLSPTPALSKALNVLYQQTGKNDWRAIGFQKTLQLLSKSVGGSSEALKAMFPNMRGLLGVFSLTGKATKIATDALIAMTKATGATDKAFNEINKSGARSWAKMVATIQVGSVLIGQKLLPNLVDATQDLIKTIRKLEADGTLAQWGKDASDAIKSILPMLETLTKFVMAHAESLMMLGLSLGVVSVIAKIIHGISALRTGLKALKSAKIIGITNDVGALKRVINGTTGATKLLNIEISGLGAGGVIAGAIIGFTALAEHIANVTEDVEDLALKLGASGKMTENNNILGNTIEWLKEHLTDNNQGQVLDMQTTYLDNLKLKNHKILKEKEKQAKILAKENARHEKINKEWYAEKKKVQDKQVASLKKQQTELENMLAQAQGAKKGLASINANEARIAKEAFMQQRTEALKTLLDKKIARTKSKIAGIEDKIALAQAQQKKAVNNLIIAQKAMNNKKQKAQADLLAWDKKKKTLDKKAFDKKLADREKLDKKIQDLLWRQAHKFHIGLKSKALLKFKLSLDETLKIKGNLKDLFKSKDKANTDLDQQRIENEKALERWRQKWRDEKEKERLAKVNKSRNAFIEQLKAVRLKISKFQGSDGMLNPENYNYSNVLADVKSELVRLNQKRIVTAWVASK